MSSYSLNINGTTHKVQTTPAMPLIWVLRDAMGLRGTKLVCGKGFCGACTVHADGIPIRACITPIDAIKNQAIMTIEGLSRNSNHPLLQAWRQHNVSQCGDCQAGQIMTAAALLDLHESVTEPIIERMMNNILCHCDRYPHIKQAILTAAQERHKP